MEMEGDMCKKRRKEEEGTKGKYKKDHPPSPFRVFLCSFRPENPEADWDDKPGLPRLVIPARCGFLLALFGQKTLKDRKSVV